MSLLRSTRLQHNIDDLMKDNIVIDMANELDRLGIDIKTVPFKTINDEYAVRGGKENLTIGAVKEAMVNLIEEREEV